MMRLHVDGHLVRVRLEGRWTHRLKWWRWMPSAGGAGRGDYGPSRRSARSQPRGLRRDGGAGARSKRQAGLWVAQAAPEGTARTESHRTGGSPIAGEGHLPHPGCEATVPARSTEYAGAPPRGAGRLPGDRPGPRAGLELETLDA